MRRLLIFLGAVLGLTVVVLLVLHFTAPKPTPLYQSKFQARNLRFPEQTSAQTIRFFTGSAFAQYDTTTHKSTSLTSEFALPTVSAVKWSPDAALIRVEGLSGANELYPLAKSISPLPAWWIVDFKRNTISPIVVKTNDQTLELSNAIWADGGSSDQYYVIGQTTSSTDRQIIKIDRSSNQSTSIYTDKSGLGLNLIGIGPNNSIIISTREALLKIDLMSRTLETLSKITYPIKDAWLTADKSILVYSYNEPSSKTPTTTLHQLSIDTHKDSKLLSTPSASLTTLSGNQLVVISNTVELYNLPNKTHQTSTLLESTDKLGRPTAAFVVPGSPTGEIFVTSDKNDLAFLTTDRDAAFKPDGVPLALFGDKVLYFKNGYATYDLLNNQLDIYTDPHPGVTFDQQKAATFTEITAQGVDANQITKHWHQLSAETD